MSTPPEADGRGWARPLRPPEALPKRPPPSFQERCKAAVTWTVFKTSGELGDAYQGRYEGSRGNGLRVKSGSQALDGWEKTDQRQDQGDAEDGVYRD